MLYWVTETISSSVRLYYESRQHPLSLSAGNRVEPPMAVGGLPQGNCDASALAERGLNVVRWTHMPKGWSFCGYEATRAPRAGYSRVLP
jgi:hypothetical protein